MLQVEKHRLVHELNVSYRDLRILDPMVHHFLLSFPLCTDDLAT